MSKDIYEGESYILTEFWGGTEQGVCLQVTPAQGEYFQLTRVEAAELATKLFAWVLDTAGTLDASKLK